MHPAVGVGAIVPRPCEPSGWHQLLSTDSPVWTPNGALLFSPPNTNTSYRWPQSGTVAVFRSYSGDSGVDIGRCHQPGSNGLTFDPDGRLVMRQHGNRWLLRVEPHGNATAWPNLGQTQ